MCSAVSGMQMMQRIFVCGVIAPVLVAVRCMC